MASEQRVSERLRQEIRELHDSIEATGSARRMIDGQIRSDEYVRLLRQMAGLHRAVEPRLAKALPAELFLAEMRRVEAIERDIEELGGRPVEPLLHPALERLIRALDGLGAESPAVWAGVLYVLEGSRMGSMILVGRLAEALGLEVAAGVGLDFHYEGMSEAPRRFKALKSRLDEWLVEDLSMDAACFGARLTMAALLELYAASAGERELAA